MARYPTLKVAFKANHQHQGMLLPPSLDDLIATDHPVRVVDHVLDQVDITALVQRYKPGGASSYHPRMLLKVMVFAYMNNIYSCRRIEEALCENIHYMWLAGMSKPDHNTINRFRGKRLADILRPIFSQVVLLLADEGLLSIKELYVDGTKIEADANRYTFVWGNAIKTSRQRITQQLDELWAYAQKVAATEMDDTDPSGFKKVDAEKVKQTIATINEALKDKPVDPKVRQKLNYAAKQWPASLDKYEQQEQILAGRKSYSKTDPDATFMRMKEDHMRNGQLKPAYNVQLSTNNQFIAAYSIHPNPTDTNTLIDHLTQVKAELGSNPSNVTADAGYGSEENYQWLEKKKITAYVKHNQFDREQNERLSKKQRFRSDKFAYDGDKDQMICPSGKPMHRKGTSTSQTSTGYEQQLTVYQAEDCRWCPLRKQCHQQKGNRIIEVNHNLRRLKQNADKRLKTKKGIAKRKQRCHDTEPVFANIKHNHQFKRFKLRGKEKVMTEMGLLALAHNLRKKAA